MKKEAKQKIKEILKRTRTSRLKDISYTLDDWTHMHILKKMSWSWNDNGNGRQQAKKEAEYYREQDLKIGTFVLHYYSNPTMSRHHVYWDEALYLRKSKENLSFGDIKYIIDTIAEIIDGRQARAEKAA